MTSRRLEQIAVAALVGSAGTLQFSIAVGQILLAVAVACWLAMLVVGRQPFRAPRVFWPLAVYAGLTLVSAAFSPQPKTSLVDCKQLVLFLLVWNTSTHEVVQQVDDWFLDLVESLEREVEYLAGVGAKEFTDATVPAGSSQVTYQLQAVRSTSVGGWAQYNVSFGTESGGGATIASVTEGTPAKIAA
jgi:hypothetical protein